MQEHYRDGSEYLQPSVTIKDVERSLVNPKVDRLTLHKPGSVVEMPSGAKYEVQKDGSWRRLPEKE